MANTTERPPTRPHKRRRVPNACDICKRKKIQCDSAEKSDNRCSNCIDFNSECTHNSARKHVASYNPSYTTHTAFKPFLESHPHFSPELGNQVNPLREVHPLVLSILSSTPSLGFDTQCSLLALSQHILSLEQEISNLKQTQLNGNTPTTNASQRCSASPEAFKDNKSDNSGKPSAFSDEVDLSTQLKRLTIHSSHSRHFGASSTFSLLGITIECGKEIQDKRIPDDNKSFGRPQFWNVHKWEAYPKEEYKKYEFPDCDLLHDLVGLYFDRVNAHFPLFHRPTYERAVDQGLYITDHHFGATLLGVCAIAARYSDDPRVLLEGVGSRHCSGWKWFRQIRQRWLSSSRTPSLYEIQTICLSILFLHGTSQPEACWVMVGVGIRCAQDVGAHRKRLNQKPSIENELWKRCFWVLLCIDAVVCSFIGRPRATVFDDVDLDFPLDCDDEYWETDDPALSFIQPPGTPSKVSGFITYLKLIEILEYAQRTLYAVNKPKRFCGTARDLSDEEAVAHLDSELNQWFDHIPDHLVWTSCSPGSVFYEQSAMLHACYHHVRILVHRPFIPSPNKPSLFPFPSLAICTNAARSCARILKSQSQQKILLPFPQVQFSIFTSAIVLLLNYRTNLKSARPPREDMKSVYDCISVLSNLEGRWTPPGRFCDVIREIISYGDVPLPTPSDQTNPERKSASERREVPVATQFQSHFPQVGSHHVPGTSQATWNPNWPSNSHAGGDIPDISDEALMESFVAHEHQWSDGRGHVQNFTQFCPPAFGGPTVSYTAEAQSTFQWSFVEPASEHSMGVSETAMWLQQPDMSRQVLTWPP